MKGDPGYSERAVGVRVFLDGFPVEKCVTADEEAGLVIVHDVDAFGQTRIDAGCCPTCGAGEGRVRTKELHGRVRIVIDGFKS